MEEPQFVTDPEEQELYEEIVRRLKQAEVFLTRFDRLRGKSPRQNSELAADDKATDWLATSHLVRVCLNMAADNIRAARDMLMVDGGLRIPLHAHYAVLRGALEAAALAAWVMRPDDPKERRKRSLQARRADLEQDHKLFEATHASGIQHGTDPALLKRGEEDHEREQARYLSKIHELSDACGLNWGHVASGLPGIERIIREATDGQPITGYYAATVWKIMSGLAHPSASRATHFASIEILSESEDGVIDARVSASANWTHQAILVTIHTFFEASELYRHRILRPSREK